METDSPNKANNAEAFEPCNKEQLGALLGVSRHILNKWLEALTEKLGPIRCKRFSSRQIKIMIDTYGRAPEPKKRNAA